MITHHSEARLWLLSTPGTSYAFRLDAGDVPRHVHWGRPLSLEQAVSVAAERPAEDPGADDRGVEYGVEGGLRFGPPSLTVRFDDGVRGFEWRFVSHTVEEDLLTLSFTDRVRSLDLDLNYRVRESHDQIERWAVLTAGEPVDVLWFDSAAWTLPARDDYRASRAVGERGRDFRLGRDRVPVGETVFTSRLGITGHRTPADARRAGRRRRARRGPERDPGLKRQPPDHPASRPLRPRLPDRRIRPVVRGGVQYRLERDAVQYLTEDEVVVFQFRPSASDRPVARTRLRGLDPDARHRDEATGAVHADAVLLGHGLPPLPPFDRTSALVHLRRVPR
ncbi:glycoside hydrolase family 36 N-terminal domain-containing protein [Streptomyces sp. NPDC056361]|uniref:glycoside hydrolase family 36 N-terminal domain-containing protein n=1 Tax=Streptomyces sp. NPDC056361 TaxID=3345795 RepID=UPI0035D938E2